METIASPVLGGRDAASNFAGEKMNSKRNSINSIIFLLFVFVAWLSGCATLPSSGIALNPSGQWELTDEFKSGAARLDCHASCAGQYGTKRPDLKRFHDAGMWKDLAVAVLTIGHYGDQEYYYLGRSAEGLGFYSAAAINYGLSIEITRSGLLNCAGLFNTCDGLVLPRDAESRLARIPKTQKNENRPVLQEKLPSTPAPAVSANCNRAYADYFEKAQAARDREKAIALYRDGLAICPNDDVAHYELGKALADRKRYADAQKEFEAALRINPGFTDARKQLDAVRDTKKQEY